MKWKDPLKDQFYLSPLLYRPAKIVLDRKIEQTYRIDLDDEIDFFVNPILAHSFSRYFDFTFPDRVSDLQNFKDLVDEGLSTANHKLVFTCEFDNSDTWQFIERAAVGNFNYKKSLLGKDYDAMLSAPSEQIIHILDGVKKETTTEKPEIRQIIGLDFSQQAAVRDSSNNNLVIQGPPGTGKSHTIVGMIGNYLAQQKKVLFVSQKRSALDVVYQRLHQLNLSGLAAFMNTEKDEKRSFFADLKDSWDQVSKPCQHHEEPKLTLTDDLTAFYLNRYQEKIPGIQYSIHDLILELIQLGFKKEEIEYPGTLPTLEEWKKSEGFLFELEQLIIKKFGIPNLSQAPFAKINKAVFSETNPIQVLDKRLDRLEKTLEEINAVQNSFKLKVIIAEFTQYALAASILNMVNKTQLDLLNQESKSYKQFSNWAKKYQLLKAKADRASMATKNWLNKPTKSQITELIDLLKHQHAPKGILGILKRRNDRLTEAFEGFDPRLSTVAKLQLLEELRTEWNVKAELEEIEIKLKHNFHILDPENEVRHILQLRNKLDSISSNIYIVLLEHPDSFELINALSSMHPKIQHYHQLAKFIFDQKMDHDLDKAKDQIIQLRANLPLLQVLEPELKKYFSLTPLLRDFISKNNELLKSKAIILNRTLAELVKFYPQHHLLSGEDLKRELDKSELEKDHFFKLNRDHIKAIFHSKIQKREKLLSTPASKLSDKEKEQKKKFRSMKKIMVHEMGKQQRHLPIKQFTSDTWPFLSDIFPLWMMNPLSVSERLNCIPEMFDVVIFDESSQIPLEDALPAIYRAKQVIIVGDDKQMPPSNFFASHSSSETLLTRADLNFPRVMLKWHYRSEHPALIEFSNRYFYENELLTIPPTNTISPISFQHVNGRYESGSNITEAKEIAAFVAKQHQALRKTIGIVAFSKEQENWIKECLQKEKVSTENLMIRNLENVQGVERDTIIISVGYGFDPSGTFRLNFGPVNQQSGMNRLNVLFTRAKRKMIVFSSVRSTDFGLTDNAGVNCLRDYLEFAEKVSQESQIETAVIHYGPEKNAAIHCTVQYPSQKIVLIDPCTKPDETSDLATIYTILKQRFKRVDIKLSKDKWEHPEKYGQNKAPFPS